MADAAVESPANQVAPHKKQLASSIPFVDSLEGVASESNDQYSTFKKLQRQLEYVATRRRRLSGLLTASQVHSLAGGVHQG